MMKRYLSIWLPDWPLTRRTRALKARTNAGAPEAPFVLTETGPHGLRVVAANTPARAQGVETGLRFTDARARCRDLESEEIDRTADRAALDRLAVWMIRLAPLVAVDGADGLMIETTGCDHLHGGEAAMMDAVSQLLTRQSIPHRLGLASTPGAASALARAAPGTVLAEGGEADGLADLPVSALRLSEEAVTLLRRFGLTRIGQLYGIDRKSLARRFAARAAADAVLLRLDQALGLTHEPVRPIRPAPAHAVRLNCPEPLLTREGIEFGLNTLTENLCADLARDGAGARGFTLTAFRADGTTSCVEIRLARPARRSAHILRLFGEQLDRIDPGFGIDLLLLAAHRTGPMETHATALSGDLAARDTDPVALAALADRITARLGAGTVKISQPVESHLPERAESRQEFEGELPAPACAGPNAGPRPIRLFARPEPIEVMAEVPDGPPLRFVWRRVARRVVRADGPERIAPEWWRHTAPPPAAQTPEGTDRKWLRPRLDPRADAALIRKIRSDLEAQQDALTGPAQANVQPLPSAPILGDCSMGARGKPPGSEPCPNQADPISIHLPRARDYYRVEDEDGRRYWLFRRGLYDDDRGGTPDWYVHGLFG